MYEERMKDYYPEVIRNIKEFNAIIEGEAPEFDGLVLSLDNVLNNAYLMTMDEARLADWEKVLNLTPFAGSTVEDRRDAVIAAIRGQGKLNSKVISAIVASFTGGTAESWIINSKLYVKVLPPPNNKNYIFDNVEKALLSKLPAHLELKVYRNYAKWEEIKSYAGTWGGVKENFDTWNDVKYFSLSTSGDDILEYIVDESGNTIANELNDKLFN